MMVGLLFYFVGAIFILNGLGLLEKIGSKEIGAWNVGISAFMFLVVIYVVLTNLVGPGSPWFAAQVLLFAFTYLFLGINNLVGNDGRGLGWFCLWVSIVTPYIAWENFMNNDVRFGLIWVVWGIMWFIFWLIMGAGKTRMVKPVAYAMLPVGILTAWLPGFLMLIGKW